jgi:dolichol-phosphate mannosyltransferase
VVPIFNEESNLPELRRRLVASLESTSEQNWEVLFVSDGSKDNSEQMIAGYHAEDSRLKLICLSRNFGHQPAITAGIHYSTGDCVILIDGDLQDPPELIPDLLAKWREGYSVVLAERESRPERGIRGMGLRLFYPVLNAITELPGGANTGIFGLMDRRLVNELIKLPERNRFIPGLRGWLGFRQGSIRYARQARASGEPKLSLTKLLKYALDGIFSFSNKPLRIAVWAGMIVSLLSFLLAVGYFLAYFLQRVPPPRGFTSILLAVLFLGGLHLICLGILGEYVGRIYEEIKQRPLYVVAHTLGTRLPVHGTDADFGPGAYSHHSRY